MSEMRFYFTDMSRLDLEPHVRSFLGLQPGLSPSRVCTKFSIALGQ